MNNVKYFSFSVVLFLGFLLFSTSSATAGIINGDFSQDPNGTGWTLSNAYVLSDSEAGGNGFAILLPDFEESKISQDNIYLLPGETQLVFDIVMYSTIGGETDTFTATLSNGIYSDSYTKSSSTIPTPVYFETVVFDLAGWDSGYDTSYYTLSFQLANQLDDEIITSVLIDNVQFVPIPDTLMLGIIGIFSVFACWKWKMYRVARI